MEMDLESMVGVTTQLLSPTSKPVSQAQMYVMEHYHEVDENV